MPSKCEICNSKINTLDALVATCKCEKKHCIKHRMPESHNCIKIKDIISEQKDRLKNSLVKVSCEKIILI